MRPVKQWNLWQAARRVFGDTIRKEAGTSKRAELEKNVRDAVNVSEMLDHPGWEVVVRLYSEDLLFQLSVLSQQLREGKYDPQIVEMQIVRLLAKADTFEEIRMLLKNAGRDKEKLMEIYEEEKLGQAGLGTVADQPA